MASAFILGQAGDLPCIFVAGSAAVGKSTLCQCITNSQQFQNVNSYPWSIVTKYYTANVVVREGNQDPVALSGKPEALVLVFNLAKPDTLAVAQCIASGFQLEAVEVKLLCGTHADMLLATGVAAGGLETASQPTCFQEAFDWSIENGFEFIICCPADPSTDRELVLDGDRQGVTRVVEALQAHTWPNLLLVPQVDDAVPSGDSYRGQAIIDGELAAKGSQKAGPHPPEAAQPPAGNAIAAAANAAAEAARPVRVQQQVCQQQEGPGQPLGGVEEKDEEHEEEAEQMLDGLERLMEEVQGHKARLATLSDEERREQAAAIALRMMGMLGIGDEGSDSDQD